MQMQQDGSFSISDSVDIKGEGCSFFVFGAAWLLEILDLTSGEFFFFSDGEPIRPAGRRFGIYYPPFTIIKSCVKDMKGSVAGVGAVGEPPSGLALMPLDLRNGFQRGACERRAGGRNSPAQRAAFNR